MEALIGSQRKGICYRCMFGEHHHCHGDNGKTICQCRRELHDTTSAKVTLGMHPDSVPPHFPSDPTANDNFYFLGVRS